MHVFPFLQTNTLSNKFKSTGGRTLVTIVVSVCLFIVFLITGCYAGKTVAILLLYHMLLYHMHPALVSHACACECMSGKRAPCVGA